MRDVLSRLRAEYLEMPGMKLTLGQVQRLCGIERTLCQCVLDALVTEQFLCLYSNGTYRRPSEGDVARPRIAKADRAVETRVNTASKHGHLR